MQKINVPMPKLKKLLELNDRRQQVCYWNFFGIYGDKNVTELREFNKIQYRRGISVKISIIGDVLIEDENLKRLDLEYRGVFRTQSKICDKTFLQK